MTMLEVIRVDNQTQTKRELNEAPLVASLHACIHFKL
jgi:hypothetical protein